MRASKALLSVVVVFFSVSAISVAQEKIEWDYFLLPEGTVKLFFSRYHEARLKDTHYQVKERSDGKMVKIRREMFDKDNTAFATFWIIFNLDENTNQVMEVERGSSLGLNFKYWDCPQIVLSLPLQVGRKWMYALPPHTVGADMQKKEVIGIKKIKVPAGEFNVYVIEVTSRGKQGVWQRGERRREYYAKGVGLVATEEIIDGKWTWTGELEKISKPKDQLQ